MQFAHELIVRKLDFLLNYSYLKAEKDITIEKNIGTDRLRFFAVCDGELEFKIDEKTWHLTARRIYDCEFE